MYSFITEAMNPKVKKGLKIGTGVAAGGLASAEGLGRTQRYFASKKMKDYGDKVLNDRSKYDAEESDLITKNGIRSIYNSHNYTPSSIAKRLFNSESAKDQTTNDVADVVRKVYRTHKGGSHPFSAARDAVNQTID